MTKHRDVHTQEWIDDGPAVHQEGVHWHIRPMARISLDIQEERLAKSYVHDLLARAQDMIRRIG